MDVVNQTVKCQRLLALPCIHHAGQTAKLTDLFEGIELTESVDKLLWLFDRIQLFRVRMPNHFDMMQPVSRESQSLAGKNGLNAAAAIVADYHDVLHAKHFDGVFDDGQTVEIRGDDQVRDISMHEHFAGWQSDDLVCRDAAVGAANPEITGGLLLSQSIKKRWIGLQHSLSPSAIIFK